jgi:hypothetical protein
VSDYGFDDRAIVVQSPAGAKDFSSSLCVQTGSGAHPAPVQWVPGVLSLGVKSWIDKVCNVMCYEHCYVNVLNYSFSSNTDINVIRFIHRRL